MDRPLRSLTHKDYTVAYICPMGVELAPDVAMLDERHQSLSTSRDQNSYTFGSIGVHNVVIAVMPKIGKQKGGHSSNTAAKRFQINQVWLRIGNWGWYTRRR
jgi:hypothetical protein